MKGVMMFLLGLGILVVVAAMFGYPSSLAERELARYKSLNRKYVLSLASA